MIIGRISFDNPLSPVKLKGGWIVCENKKEGGFYLNVPGRIKLSFYRESHFLAAFDLYAAQFGFVELRSGSLFKRYVTHMQLNPTTGSVEKIHADM